MAAGRVAEGLKVTGVPTSEATRRQAERLGIPGDRARTVVRLVPLGVVKG